MRFIKLSIVLLYCILLFAASGCYYDEIGSVTAIDREVSYTNDIVPLWNQSCNSAGCHNTGGIKPDLTAGNSFNALINGGYINIDNAQGSELYEYMIGTKPVMPPTGKLPDAEISLILGWIEQGALNN